MLSAEDEAVAEVKGKEATGKEATDPHGVAGLISSVVASEVASEGSDNDTHFHIRLLLSFPTNSD